MDLYLDFARKAFQQQFVYKANTIFGVISRFLLLFIQVSVWTALYNHRAEVSGISLEDMVTFILLGMMIEPFTRSYIDRRIAQRVQEGCPSRKSGQKRNAGRLAPNERSPAALME
jgi:ABC-2 type transport system permease protein